jgi:hypothetical protein
MKATIDVVVVLPCAPATATPYFRRINSASISARGMTGMWRARASATSGLSGRTADDTTTTSAAPTLPAAWPSCTRTPSPARRRVMSEDFASDPPT